MSLTYKKIIFCGILFTICAVISGVLLATSDSVVSRNSSESTLQFVIVVCRHGSRSPLFFYPTDPYNNPKYWPNGKGFLTNFGRQQMYSIGQNLKNRYYMKLFNGKYNQKDIYVKSTQTSRTYMSIAILLAGLFPPVGDEIWNSELLWQPVPIWPDVHDKTEIVTNTTACKKFSNLQQQVLIDSQDYLRKNEDLFYYVIKHSGHKLNTIRDFGLIWDPLSCEDALNLSLPTWTKSVYPEQLTIHASYMFNTMVSGTREMNRLVIGPLLKDFNVWINRTMSGTTTEKMLLHSGHDFTIFALLRALGFIDVQVVKPAASIMIEFHQSSEGHYVKLFYSNHSSMVEPVQMDMPKCRDPCKLEEFIRVTKEMETKDDWESECNSK